MDVHTGEILGMGSYPTYDPGVFSGVLKQSTYDEISSKANGLPIINRTIGAVYPPGSTFKAITSIANMQAGLLEPELLDQRRRRLGVRRLQVAERRQRAARARST